MNLASWAILAVVVAVVALAIRATFFKKVHCDCRGGDRKLAMAEGGAKDGDALACASSCSSCSACSSCPARSFAAKYAK